MEDKKDLSKVPLITLLIRLDDIDAKLTGLLIKREETDYSLEELKIEYNEIIEEIHKRFPPLKKDAVFQPKVMKKK